MQLHWSPNCSGQRYMAAIWLKTLLQYTTRLTYKCIYEHLHCIDCQWSPCWPFVVIDDKHLPDSLLTWVANLSSLSRITPRQVTSLDIEILTPWIVMVGQLTSVSCCLVLSQINCVLSEFSLVDLRTSNSWCLHIKSTSCNSWVSIQLNIIWIPPKLCHLAMNVISAVYRRNTIFPILTFRMGQVQI